MHIHGTEKVDVPNGALLATKPNLENQPKFLEFLKIYFSTAVLTRNSLNSMNLLSDELRNVFRWSQELSVSGKINPTWSRYRDTEIQLLFDIDKFKPYLNSQLAHLGYDRATDDLELYITSRLPVCDYCTLSFLQFDAYDAINNSILKLGANFKIEACCNGYLPYATAWGRSFGWNEKRLNNVLAGQ